MKKFILVTAICYVLPLLFFPIFLFNSEGLEEKLTGLFVLMLWGGHLIHAFIFKLTMFPGPVSLPSDSWGPRLFCFVLAIVFYLYSGYEFGVIWMGFE